MNKANIWWQNLFTTLLLTGLVMGPVMILSAQQTRPNILWITSEDNSPLIGAYGDEFATTPFIDQLASEGVLYENAFAAAPVCAPSRSALITSVYPTSLGTQHMRSRYPLPEEVRFFPEFLKKAGYYTTNNSKTDYNTSSDEELIPLAWDECSNKATYLNKKEGQPFFAVFNTTISHESSLHKPVEKLKHDPDQVPIPPYHPRTPEMKHDWAQYYDKIEEMDARVGEVLKELEESGYADNTIVFYYSDHGGVLGRSKRFLYDSGLHVPLIIRFPEKYQHLAPGAPGTRTDRVVTFVDFGPTVLSLAGLSIPEYIQGKAFLGEQEAAPREYAPGFRGRMDERIDMSRTIRDKKYRYTRNFLPHKIYAQYIEYLWRAPSMGSWEREFEAGKLNDVQSRFWLPKPIEELYDTEADPHNIHNLAEDPDYRQVLERMRKANRDWMVEIRDVGFIPEALLSEIAASQPLYQYSRNSDYPISTIYEAVEAMSRGDQNAIENNLKSPDPILRYWAATSVTMNVAKMDMDKKAVKALLDDKYACIRIAAAEALYQMGEVSTAVGTLTSALKDENMMARVQALNILQLMGDKAQPALTAAKALIPTDPENRDYDVRAAIGLVEELEN